MHKSQCSYIRYEVVIRILKLKNDYRLKVILTGETISDGAECI